MEVQMSSKRIVSAVMAACVGFSGVAFAQQDKDVRSDEANRREHMGRSPGGERPDARRESPAPRYVEQDRGRDHGNARDRDRGPGAGPEHNFYRGGRLPPEYRSPVYVVDDWRDHRLTQPPRGYHWVQTGGDYVLVAVATGIIASILLNH
jgi:Ni/Co efflux regulator RcnB